MPTSSGPNTAAESNIIFSYDTGDVTNSYRGEPTTNLYTTLGFSFYQAEGGHSATRTTGAAPGLNLPTNYDYHTITTTSSWETESKRLIIWPNNSLSSSTTYYVSFWARVISQPTAQIGSAFYGRGLENTLTLTSQWQRFSFSSLTHPSYRALEVGSKDGALIFQIAGLQIEAKSHVTPYVNGTRSETVGLVPLIGNSTIDLSNISFNSAAQITFDGSDDYLTVSNPSNYVQGTSDFSLEFVFNKAASGGNNGMLLEARGASLVGFFLYVNMSDSVTVLALNHNSSQQWVSFGNFGAYAPNTNYHIVVTVRRGSYQASHFVNGNLVQVASISHSNTITPGSSYRYNIGQDLGGAPYYGNILLHKLYNTALSADQVKQNYKQYKSRFNLS